MIIGVAGHIGSGKDTVGKIIQYLTRDSSLLTYDYDEFIKCYYHNYVNPTWQIKKFAYAVKQVCSILTGIPIEDFEKQEVKDRILGEEWTRYGYADGFMRNMDGIPIMNNKQCSKERYEEELRTNWQTAYKHKYTVRELLQLVGTNAIRNVIHEDAWVNALMSQYDTIENKVYTETSKAVFDKPIHIGTTTKRQEKTRFKCICGKEFISTLWRIETGHTKSCGCLQAELARRGSTKHGDSYSKLMSIYKNMKTRCTNPNATKYEKYGGKGVSICNDWLISYDTFKSWALNNGYCDGLSLDRKDTNGNYEPSNCRWITLNEQMLNKNVYTNNELNVRGVSFKNNKYYAQIQHNGNKLAIGYFDTIEKASAAYENKRKELFIIQDNTKNWIITDTRFLNEVKAIKDRNGFIIRVNRNNSSPQDEHIFVNKQQNTHPSETALDDYDFDYVVDNNGTIENLITSIKSVLICENILRL